jgi:hypothetical protein
LIVTASYTLVLYSGDRRLRVIAEYTGKAEAVAAARWLCATWRWLLAGSALNLRVEQDGGVIHREDFSAL